MPSMNEQPPVLNEVVFYLLYPHLAPQEEQRLVARYCATCAARLDEERPVERVDTGLWCAPCQGQISADTNPRKPGFLYGEDEEWYIFYRFCPQCGAELPPRPIRRGETVGSKVFCRECYTDRPSWLVAQQEIEIARSRMICDQFWSDCQHGHLHTMPHGPRVYGLQLYPKVYHTASED